ncbi:MAG TPA: hypothetical protein VEK78_16025 [Gemmatimonadales bacterium]|nr:hypothetical protein [Gemmatimonadales bacterium]HYT83723.1 hypothetical protein [Gemmatimonadales bacterium]
MRALRAAWLAATLGAGGAAGCVERVSAPGQCPEFCPSGSIQIVDTVLATNIERDSAFRGYAFAHRAAAMYLADVPGAVDSRGILATAALTDPVTLPGDTNPDPILGSDSLKLAFTITRRDTAAHNLLLTFYRLPFGLDSTTTFADLAGPFGGAPLRTVNLDSLLAKVARDTSGNLIGVDSATGDAVTVDTTNRRLRVTVKFDSAQAPYVAADSGRLGFGIRVGADVPTSLGIATRASGILSAGVTWYVRVDSTTAADTTLVHEVFPGGITLDSYVFDPPPAPLDSTLAVGGVPSARSLLRVTLPRAIRDSAQIVRATLVVIPAVAWQGAPTDSFVVEAHTVLADFGAKSPIAVDVTRTDTALIRMGAKDTVRIEVTNLVQFWVSDTLAPTALMLRPRNEAGSPAEVRFYPSAAAASRPSLRLTYARRFPFGRP